MQKDTSERLLEWSEKIRAQKLSSKTERNWCQEQGIPYSKFQYWKARIKKRNSSVTVKYGYI